MDHVADVMTQKVRSLRPTDTVAEAVKLMRELHIDAVPVCEDDGRLVGLVFERDAAMRTAPEDDLLRDVQIFPYVGRHVEAGRAQPRRRVLDVHRGRREDRRFRAEQIVGGVSSFGEEIRRGQLVRPVHRVEDAHVVHR